MENSIDMSKIELLIFHILGQRQILQASYGVFLQVLSQFCENFLLSLEEKSDYAAFFLFVSA